MKLENGNFKLKNQTENLTENQTEQYIERA